MKDRLAKAISRLGRAVNPVDDSEPCLDPRKCPKYGCCCIKDKTTGLWRPLGWEITGSKCKEKYKGQFLGVGTSCVRADDCDFLNNPKPDKK